MPQCALNYPVHLSVCVFNCTGRSSPLLSLPPFPPLLFSLRFFAELGAYHWISSGCLPHCPIASRERKRHRARERERGERDRERERGGGGRRKRGREGQRQIDHLNVLGLVFLGGNFLQHPKRLFLFFT